MPGWQVAILVGYGVLILIALARHLLLSREMRQATFLRPDDPKPAAGAAPKVSILIPAKNESANIERCLRSVLSQEFAPLEILVADDRSDDDTAAIIERIAALDPRLKLHRITELPPGWTGKTHALDVLQRQAKGDWLLFVDADAELHPACLGVTVARAEQGGLEMLSVLPKLTAESFWEKAVQPFASACLGVLYPMSKVNDPANPDSGFANGQFILIRRRAYDAIGGHQAVRDKFVEDIHLGRLVRRAGMKSLLAMARDVVAVRMYDSLERCFRGWSRIFYSAVDSRPAKLVPLILLTFLFSVSSYVVLLVAGGLLLAGYYCPFLATLFAMGVVHEIVQTTIFWRVYGLTRSSKWNLVWRPLAVFVTLGILFQTLRLCYTHRVEWRGTIYDGALTQG
ncbi:MAG TPA: glycosyltransferase family 2 protein [Planctomycetia bacterium]|nr:glycosyltransferase family 2 protein [Planctomycetia bacterium]